MYNTGKLGTIIILAIISINLSACSALPLNDMMWQRHIGEGEDSGEQSKRPQGYTRLEAEKITPTKAPVQTPEPAAVEEIADNAVTITISAAGDCTLGNHRDQDYSYSFNQVYAQTENKAYFFDGVYDIFSQDDFTIVNLEGPLTNAEEGREEQTYCIKGLPEYAHILTLGDIEGVTFANNHQRDYYEAGIQDTVNALNEEGIAYAYGSVIGRYETKGVKIGWVSVNEVGNGAAVEKDLKNGIETLKNEGTDIILACPHWGIEKEYLPEDYQIVLGRKCIDWGADIVLGCHPHVLESIELYKEHYIIYSMANFCFGANRSPEDRDTMIVQQTYTFEDGVRTGASDIRIIPCSVSSSSDRNDFRPCIAEGKQKTRIIDRLNEYSEGFGVRLDYEGNVVK